MTDAAPPDLAALSEQVDALQHQNAANVELLSETITELELQLEDESWVRLVQGAELEFSRGGLDKLVRLCRIMALKNPLVRRACRVQGLYVFGQGVETTGRDEGADAVIQRFQGDPRNRSVLFGHQARMARNRTLLTDGNLFLRLFPDRATGHLRIRRIPFTQVSEIRCDPGDSETVWFYRREWTDGTGRHLEWYPDWRLPQRRSRAVVAMAPRDGEVRWDTPVYHVAVEGLDDMAFGMPELYSSVDWARAYVRYQENFASVADSLARFAWKATGSKRARSSMMSRLDTTLGVGGSAETNPPPLAGSVAAPPEGADLTPIPKTGMNIDSEGGRQLRLMVASAVDLPDTILAGDPDQGNLATATTLDRPTELAMRERQMLWAAVERDLCEAALISDARSSRGLLRGARVEVDPAWGTERVLIDGEAALIDVSFPPVLESDPVARVQAVISAQQAGLLPDDQAARMAMLALGVEDVDELVDELADARRSDGARAEADLARAVESLREAVARS